MTSVDVDNENTFTAQADVEGEFGTFSIDENGAWTFVANSAFDELNEGDSVEEAFVVTSVNGTEATVTVTITGTDDAAIISGDSAVSVEETNEAQTITGQLTSVRC